MPVSVRSVTSPSEYFTCRLTPLPDYGAAIRAAIAEDAAAFALDELIG